MTLLELFELFADNPMMILGYFLLIPFTAFLAYILGRHEGHLSPWKYLYTVLIYMVSIPGLFAVILNIYLFLFERRPILETDVYSQILPIFSMVGTLLLIKANVDLEKIPGFEKLTAFLMIVSIVMGIMWILDKTHIIAFTYIPFYYVILILVGLIAMIRIGWKKMAG